MAISYSDENLKLQANNYQLTIQNIQYENLKERMDEVKRARHDLRYHMGAIYSLVQKEEYSKLKEYLEEYLTFSPASQPLSYCSHFALNAVISYYAQLALSDQIRFSAEIATPQDIPISDADLTVLFGSLLENAYNGCLFLPEKDRFIRLKATMPNNNTLVFTIDNSCLDAEEAKKEAEDTRSTTHKGTGVGIESVRNIVDRYGGLVQFEKPKDTFCVSGVLYC